MSVHHRLLPVSTHVLATAGLVLAAVPLCAQSGPALIPLDSLILEEDDEHYVSQPLAVTFGPEGQILISDGIANAVLEFNRTGTFVRAFGRAGEGPGEFRLAGGALVTGDILAVVDVMALEFEVFDYRSGEPLGALPMRPQLMLSTVAAVGDSIWIAGIDRASWMAIGTVSPGEIEALVRSGSKNQHALHFDRVAVPEPYRASRVMSGALGHAFLDIGDNDFVIAFAGSPYVLRSGTGPTVDTLHLEARLRRGFPSDAELAGAELHPVNFANEISVLGGVSRDNAGNILVVHSDLNVADMQFTGERIYVSAVAADGSWQCADTPVPLAGVGSPRTVLTGNHLLIVDQVPTAGDVATVLRWFEVDASGCGSGWSR